MQFSRLKASSSSSTHPCRSRRGLHHGPPQQAAAVAASSTASGTSTHQHTTTPSHQHYQQLLKRRAEGGCPALLLAPMENLMDSRTRIALLETLHCSGLCAFDEACTEFIRVPSKSERPAATIRGITAGYNAGELQGLGGGAPVALAAQLMGSSTELLAAAARHLVEVKGAPRIDLNCGCPANVVTGHGAGSSLLRDPTQLHRVVAAMVAAVGHLVPVSVKMRSGFQDTALFTDNLLAVQGAGAAFVTIHPRTKQQSYSGSADWALIAKARSLLNIPVVGNGDVICVSSAVRLIQETGCDGVMIGRGALQDPLLFHRIRSHFAQQQQQHQPHLQQRQHQQQQLSSAAPHAIYQGVVNEAAVVCDFIQRYAASGFEGGTAGGREVSQSGRLGRLKKVMKYLFCGQPELRAACETLLRVHVRPEQLLEDMLQQVELHWQPGGPQDKVLVSHMSMPGSSSKGTWQQQTGAQRSAKAATPAGA